MISTASISLLAGTAFVALAPILISTPVQAQEPTAPKGAIPSPDSVNPTKRPGESLSRQLDRNKGVIQPPGSVDPEMAIPAPRAGSQTTPVIPPPGSSGNNKSPQPK